METKNKLLELLNREKKAIAANSKENDSSHNNKSFIEKVFDNLNKEKTTPGLVKAKEDSTAISDKSTANIIDDKPKAETKPDKPKEEKTKKELEYITRGYSYHKDKYGTLIIDNIPVSEEVKKSVAESWAEKQNKEKRESAEFSIALDKAAKRMRKKLKQL
jgi:hypothetical protein